jgi:hypothetical protein
MYDFGFSTGIELSEVCQLDDEINNPNPALGCNLFRAALGFGCLSWFPSPLAWLTAQASVDHLHDLDNRSDPQTRAKGTNGATRP